MVALLDGGAPVVGGMYLPVTGTLYVAEAEQGVWRDGQPVGLTKATDLATVLCACCMDATSDPGENARQGAELGRLGGFVNYCTKIWDIAAPALAIREAGGRFTDLDGRDIVFRLDAEPFDRNYAVVGASATLHPQILAALRG
jgi:fructose-1,6-bisphosphatase/inositol monophosphatase family enzyme